MTQLTQGDFILELKVRGWSRFDDASLIRYLDWALQDVYRLGKFEAVRDGTNNGELLAGEYDIPFGNISGNDDTAGFTESIHAINALYIEAGSGGQENATPLIEASREFFRDTMFSNRVSSNASPAVGRPTRYYVMGETVHLYPTADQVYTWTAHFTYRSDFFEDDAATSGLPERMDTAILAAAEVQCNKRARDINGMAVAESVLNGLINGEIANEKRQFTEEAPRIGRYEH